MARRCAQSADGAGRQQSLVAAVLRPGARRNRERLWHAGHAAKPSGVARLAGERVRGGGPAHESRASPRFYPPPPPPLPPDPPPPPPTPPAPTPPPPPTPPP